MKKPFEFSGVVQLLDNMTREELRNLARVAKVSPSKRKTDTIVNLSNAIDSGALGYKMIVSLSLPRNEGQRFRSTIATKIYRSYKLEKVEREAAPIMVPVAAGD